MLRDAKASGLTEAERNVVDRLVEAWNSFQQLPVEHNDDLAEFRFGIHVLQRQVLARPTRRELNSQE